MHLKGQGQRERSTSEVHTLGQCWHMPGCAHVQAAWIPLVVLTMSNVKPKVCLLGFGYLVHVAGATRGPSAQQLKPFWMR